MTHMTTQLFMYISLSFLIFSSAILGAECVCVQGLSFKEVDVSLLYWKLGGNEGDYAVDSTHGENFRGYQQYEKKFHDISGHYAPGFRLSLGMDLPCICWDAEAIWTHFDSQQTNRQRLKYRGGVEVSAAIPFFKDSETTLTSAQKGGVTGSLNFKMDLIDFQWGKWLECDPCLRLRPFVGLRAAHIREKFHSEADFYSTVSQGNPVDHHTRLYNEFKGAGPLAGLDGEWNFCEGFSMIGKVGASLVWGYTKVRNQFTKYNHVLIGDINYFSQEKEHYRYSRTLADLSLGIRYRSCLCSYPILLELSWEHHYLFNQHRFFASDTASSENGFNFKKKGSLSLQGLAATAGVAF